MKFTAKRPVPAEAVMNAFVGTIETGYDWFHKFHAPNHPPALHPWWAETSFFEQDDFQIEVTYENHEEGLDLLATKTIGPADIQKGLDLLAEQLPDQLENLLSESNHDVETYDVLMQFVVFGEIIYG